MDRHTLLSLLSAAPQSIVDAAATAAFEASRSLPFSDVMAWLHDAPAAAHAAAPPQAPSPREPRPTPPTPAYVADDLDAAIVRVLQAAGLRGVALGDIARAVEHPVSRVQRALGRMRQSGAAVMTGDRRGARWHAPDGAPM